MSEKTIWNHHMPLGRFLSLLTKSYYGALTKKLEHLDMEHYYSILITIESFQGKNCSQQTLCDYLQVDKASMVKRIDYLAKKGLVKRNENPSDRREHCICLTDKAKEILPDIHKAVNELNEEATRGLTKQQKEEFYEGLWKVYDNISGQPAHKVTVNFKKVK
jgi:MarR family transcriptional regulator, transcriptional regulator for hemolysin